MDRHDLHGGRVRLDAAPTLLGVAALVDEVVEQREDPLGGCGASVEPAVEHLDEVFERVEAL